MNKSEHKNKIPIGISSCLLGEKVRYDGGHKNNPYIAYTLGEFFEFISFCPEMNIGLGVPRETLRLVETAGEIKCVGTQTKSLDVTGKLTDCANQQDWHRDMCGYIFKKGSPSCGTKQVKVDKNNKLEFSGVGIYVKTLMNNFPNLPVIDEEQLGDMSLRENFIQRVFIYRHWCGLLKGQFTWTALRQFHQQHELILLSHDPQQARKLQLDLSAVVQIDIQDYAVGYFSEFMKILKVVATRSKHVNVLEYIRGFLEDRLDVEAKRELTELVSEYQSGEVPLVVPITILKHYFRRYPDKNIENSYYMYPHTHELMMLNSI